MWVFFESVDCETKGKTHYFSNSTNSKVFLRKPANYLQALGIPFAFTISKYLSNKNERSSVSLLESSEVLV